MKHRTFAIFAGSLVLLGWCISAAQEKPRGGVSGHTDGGAHVTVTEVTAATHFANLPEAASSFGAVVSGGWLYVYGGHVAQTHSYSTTAVSGEFRRLNLATKKWERLRGGPGLQGMNLAVYERKIYRIGGMSPHNKPGEKEAIYSVADCARFDPATMQWESIAPLPEPRSSHDVAVVGDKLIVVGGWTLKGQAGEEWLDHMEIMDLGAQKPEWKSVRQPFERRALIAGVLGGRMYVMGGIDARGMISHEVDIYDPATNSWTQGSELPGGFVNGFAPAACVHDGRLYVSVADGSLYVLNSSGSGWEKVGSASPRVAHRLAPFENDVLVIGGAEGGQNLASIDAIAVAR